MLAVQKLWLQGGEGDAVGLVWESNKEAKTKKDNKGRE